MNAEDLTPQIAQAGIRLMKPLRYKHMLPFLEKGVTLRKLGAQNHRELLQP